MKKFILSKEEHINYIIDHFDFKKVHSVMEFLDWRIIMFDDKNEPYRVPTIEELKERAKDLLDTAYSSYNDDFYSVSSGGFKATRFEEYLELRERWYFRIKKIIK
jgi:hypothetical protein